MPQMEPFTLGLQWNSTVIIIALTIIGLACYVLPIIARLMIARTHISI